MEYSFSFASLAYFHYFYDDDEWSVVLYSPNAKYNSLFMKTESSAFKEILCMMTMFLESFLVLTVDDQHLL